MPGVIKGVYCLTSPSGKRYVGIGMSKFGIERRWSYYKRIGCKNQRKLYHALKKYGPENFKYEVIIETNDVDRAKKVEKNLIALWNLQNDEYGYNISSGGDYGNLGLKRTIQFREECAIRAKGNRNRLGKHFTQEAKDKIGKANKGKVGFCSKYKIITENNEIIIKNLSKYCRETGLNYDSMLDVAAGRRNNNFGIKVIKI